MLLASAVVVWEWLNEHGRWRPYSPAVCHHIEAVMRSDPRTGSVVLGQVDTRLSPYIIDLHSMHQFRQDTGTLRPVRRSFYDPASAPGQGWLWEWENDSGSWTAYDTESMTQINRQTNRRRRIQRRSDLAYPLVSGPLPKAWGASSPGGGASAGGLVSVGATAVSGSGGAAFAGGSLSVSSLSSLSQPCACPQCMLVLSVKASAMAHTLGRRPAQTKPPSPKLTLGGRLSTSSASPNSISYSHTLPHPLSLSRSLSAHRSPATYAQSLSLLGPAPPLLSLSSARTPPPPLPSLPPPLLPPSHPHQPPLPPPPPPPPISSAPPASNPSSATNSVTTTLLPSASLIPTATASSLSSLPAGPPPAQRPTASSAACTAPLPARSSLAGLSRPTLHRIAMAQSRALIASGVPTVPVKNLNGSSPVHPALAGITGILMSAAGLPVCLTRPPKLVLHPPPVSKSDIKPIPGLGHCCRKTSKKQARKSRTPEEVVKKYLQKVRNPPEEDCTICMEPLGGPSGYKGPSVGGVSRGESVGRLAQCGHQYHLQCLVAMYNNGNRDGSLQCPTCKTIYGVKTGSQPPGKMEYHVIPHSLPGHPDCRTIRIIYTIPPGIQGPEHPNPGKPFTARGFPRHCYLPDSEKGRKVLRLLLVAWDRRLLFSVGTSSTTGESDTVIWNEIHHKTEFGSNLTGHGYPDPGHLDNVLEELRAQGITEEDSLPHD
ncbi:E3 ubiquitin-protein ligase DTX4-like isoform X2 [Brienomyrus brachyistius]|uniref:E3 ubiquitin-protein ligase DTX4-like isoform X2 n=1 Tax=Brienomyrus brachyistius TaxID=42636 RepID=UPI0020B378C4|nr:E3 ubiquitin-protein ligase DTX4-like isoform X2 [Brienomyrus brachyistius]